ncbi:NAD-dependent DNA ligase [Chromatiales bacterium (ex Bugula neritina AB1)]|nr:NAD-dependent DNA ligase [Chromatiales bacterium (ex Bugula neritina AB1)]
MNIYTRFNNNNIQDRQIDTLIGLSKGLTADGKINRSEADFLHSWLVQNSHTEHPITINLLQKVSLMLEDDIFDSDESKELMSVLHLISGEKSEFGELAKTSSLPVCVPPPKIDFVGKSFLFTGTCAFGARRICQEAIVKLGGVNAKSVNKSLNYLILGTYVTDSWMHESFGRKIEKAMEYRESGLAIAIVTEECWLNEAGL